MKLSIIATWALSLLPATALALPVEGRQIDRQVLSSLTTQYIFDMAVGQFMTLRETQNPTALDWTSDGCSDSPDNPLGFDFVRTCLHKSTLYILNSDLTTHRNQLASVTTLATGTSKRRIVSRNRPEPPSTPISSQSK